jgi:hypothetical protein
MRSWAGRGGSGGRGPRSSHICVVVDDSHRFGRERATRPRAGPGRAVGRGAD